MARKASFYHHLHPPRHPAREARFFYTFGLGGISLLLCVMIGLTGVLEMFYYTPSMTEANNSLHIINLLVPYGKFIRSMHYWAGQALVVTSILHLLRVVLTGAYKPPRRFNWLLGLSLLVMVLFFDFTGYALRWDNDIAWALMVGTNLLKTIPIFGDGIYSLIVGGDAIGGSTIVRFYGWHILGLSIFFVFILGWHIFKVRRDGGISRIEGGKEQVERISRDILIRREAQAALVVLILLVSIASLFPPKLGNTADFRNLPVEATAPWFFLWVQELLRYGSPFLMGVLIPGSVLTLLALIPYIFDRNKNGVARWFNKEGRFAQIVILVILALVLGLTMINLL